ncbi:MAG: alpha-galactosidase, partial [Clostridia bacterium]|nr:alpha-galactosidase [Clostridia bacterium]
FPNGLKGYTDKIKDMGLKPAVWVGGFCPVCSKIYKERKEWFIDLKYRTETSQPLDVSNKDTRKYMRGAISKFVKDYGFMGIKHDFWSYAFEESHDNYSDKSKAGYEYRRWWQKIFVDLLGKDGYVGTACDLSLGNPFIGRYFNNYRFGLDICAGKWSNLLVTMFWGVGCLGTHTGDLFIPNCDSIGLLPNLNDTDFLFWINHAIITRTIVEISGLYSQVGKNDKRLKILQKATACLNNGESVYFAGFDYRAKNDLPSIYYINSLYFARNYRYKTNAKTFAVFNPFDSEKEIAVDFKDINLQYDKATITDVWNGESKTVEKGFKIVLLPHKSRLFTACESVKPNICDGNCEILNLKRNAKSLDFSVDYPVDAELTVNFKVKSVVVNGNAKEFYQKGGKLRFKINGKSDISLLIK